MCVTHIFFFCSDCLCLYYCTWTVLHAFLSLDLAPSDHLESSAACDFAESAASALEAALSFADSFLGIFNKLPGKYLTKFARTRRPRKHSKPSPASGSDLKHARRGLRSLVKETFPMAYFFLDVSRSSSSHGSALIMIAWALLCGIPPSSEISYHTVRFECQLLYCSGVMVLRLCADRRPCTAIDPASIRGHGESN